MRVLIASARIKRDGSKEQMVDLSDCLTSMTGQPLIIGVANMLTDVAWADVWYVKEVRS